MKELDHYTVVRELAAGGMGKVYVARHEELGREVALKVIHSWRANEETLQRFLLEGTATARLQHPGVVPVHELGTYQGEPCIVMPLVDGESLADRLQRDGPLPVDEAARTARDVAAALAYAHGQGILHRDLKPSNVLVSSEGRALLTDFGLAKDLSETRERLTRTGQLMGTPAFMPPEQVEGAVASIGPPADVYGLGATLYALLTGRAPFQGASPINIITQVLSKAPQPPSALRAEVPPDLEAVCLKCLAKLPADRYASAAELEQDLARFLAGEPVLGRPPQPKRKLGLLLIPLALLALTAAGIALTRAQDPPPSTPAQAPPSPPPEPAPEPKSQKQLEAERAAADELDGISRLRDPKKRSQGLASWLAAHPRHPEREQAREQLEFARQRYCLASHHLGGVILRCALIWNEPTGDLVPTDLRALVGTQGGVQLIDLEVPRTERTWRSKPWVNGLARLSNEVLLARKDLRLYRLELDAAQPARVPGLEVRKNSKRALRALVVNPAETLAAVGSVDTIKVLTVTDGSVRTLTSGDPGECKRLGFLDDARLVSAVALRGKPDRFRLEIWDLAANRRVAHEELGGDLRDLAVSGRSQRIAVGYYAGPRGVVSVFDADLTALAELGDPTLTGLPSLGGNPVVAVAFSPDGLRVHSLTRQEDERLFRETWDLTSVQRLGERIDMGRRKGKPREAVWAGLEVSADGRWALVLFTHHVEVWGLPG